MKQHAARTLLEVIGRQLPGVWTTHEMLRYAGRQKAHWPQWCYAPLAMAEPLCDARVVHLPRASGHTDAGGRRARSLEDGAMYPCCIRLGGESIGRALAQTFSTGQSELDSLKAAVTPVISVLLYLCAQNADVSRHGIDCYPVRPTPTRTRN